MAACVIAASTAGQRSRRLGAGPGSLCGHIKTERPHLEAIRDLGEFEREPERVTPGLTTRTCDTARLHAAIGYLNGHTAAPKPSVLPAGLAAACQASVAYRRTRWERSP